MDAAVQVSVSSFEDSRGPNYTQDPDEGLTERLRPELTEPEPLPETFAVTADNLPEAQAWVRATAAHYEDPHTVSWPRQGGLEISDPAGRQLAQPGDTLTYGEKTGVVVKAPLVPESDAAQRWSERIAGREPEQVPLRDAMRAWQETSARVTATAGTPEAAAAFEAHKLTSGALAAAWIREFPAPADAGESFLAGLPRDHELTPAEEAQLDAARARHPVSSATPATATPAGGAAGLTQAMPQGLGMDGGNVTALNRGARLN
jgi:hypothetical protein